MKHQDRLIPIQTQNNTLNDSTLASSANNKTNDDSSTISTNGESMDIENPLPAEQQF